MFSLNPVVDPLSYIWSSTYDMQVKNTSNFSYRTEVCSLIAAFHSCNCTLVCALIDVQNEVVAALCTAGKVMADT